MADRGRLAILGAAALGCGALVANAIRAPLPRLVWNASASAPIGLYRVAPGPSVAVGDMVIGRLPADVRLLAARRHYLPLGVPLVKRVVAGPGARICARGDAVTVDGRLLVRRRTADRAGRPLPAWTGCRILTRDQVLLVMTTVPDSFDGRYFGPTARGDVIGKAVLLWAR